MPLTTQQMLDAALTAYHALQTGSAVARLRDQNGEDITYTVANASRLAAYIADLQRQLGLATVSGPMRVWF